MSNEEYPSKGMRFTNKTNRWFCFIGIAVLVAWNIINTCQIYPRKQEVQFDYIGVIVTILSILVTVLVCWNIFNYIQFERRIKEYVVTETEKLKQDIEAKDGLLNKRIKDTISLAKAEIYAVSSLGSLTSKNWQAAISLFYIGVANCFNAPTENNFYKTLSIIKDVLRKLKTDVYFPDKSLLDDFHETATKSKDNDIITYTEKLIAFNNKQKEEQKKKRKEK